MSLPLTRTNWKMYLGDGAFVDYDENLQVVKLTAENGLEATNTIFLGPNELGELIRWWSKLVSTLGGDL